MRYGRVVVLAALGLAGCANLAGLGGFATGPLGQRASPCEVAIAGAATPRDAFKDTREARMTTGGNGWCGWAVRLVDQNEIQYPWDRAIVARAPAHGEVRVVQEGQVAHIEYRPAPGYRGADSFAVKLAPGLALRGASVEVVAPAPGPTAPETVITSTRYITPPGHWWWY